MKHFWIGTLLCATLLFSIISHCFSYSLSAKKADSLYVLGQFNDAALLYEYQAFKAIDYNLFTESILKKSFCLKQSKKFEQAVSCLKRISFSSISDSLIYLVKYQTALNYYLSKEWTLAESELIMMPEVSNASIVNKEILHILILNELRKWDEAKTHLNSLITNKLFSDSSRIELSALYEQKVIPKMKSKTKAERLSTFLPGTGQLYAGYFWEGATNVAIQATLVGLTAYGVYLKYYLSSGLAGISLLQKFYLGGVSRAGFLAEKTNYSRTRKHNDKIRGLLVPYLTSM